MSSPSQPPSPPPPPPPTTKKGTCNCGAIAVAIPAAAWPAQCVRCYCANCRASSGSAFSVNLRIRRGDVVITKGTPKVYRDGDTASGNVVGRRFCGECGSAVMSITEGQEEGDEWAFVKGGLFAKTGVDMPEEVVSVWQD